MEKIHRYTVSFHMQVNLFFTIKLVLTDVDKIFRIDLYLNEQSS